MRIAVHKFFPAIDDISDLQMIRVLNAVLASGDESALEIVTYLLEQGCTAQHEDMPPPLLALGEHYHPPENTKACRDN